MEPIERQTRLEHIRFHNPANGYTVGVFEDLELKAPFVGTGILLSPQEDQKYTMKGEETVHPKYGRQFHFTAIEKQLPSQKEAMVKFLSGPGFPGIGKKTAEAICDQLGDNALEQMQEDPDVLDGLVHPAKKEVLLAGLREFSGSSQDFTRLLSLGLSEKQAALLQSTYKDVFAVLEDNPFQPLYEVNGFGYQSALKLADALEVPEADSRRTDARIFEQAKNLSVKTGDTYVTFYSLYDQLRDLSPESFEASLARLHDAGFLYVEGQEVYPFTHYDDEITIARELAIRLENTESPDEKQLEKKIGQVEFAQAITYDAAQKAAIRQFFQTRVSILNGGPGTGKTTVVKCILELCRTFFPNQKIQLAAPTGRAAKRLAQLSDNDAKTIHSLLHWDKDKNTFAKNENDPLDCDILIVDEFSMVDVWLFASLLRATPEHCRILLIGDENQLESVLPGKVLTDLIESDLIPVTSLHQIFRQKEGSGIISLCQQIREERPCQFQDGVTFQQESQEAIPQCVRTYMETLLQGGEDLDPFASIQVLAPMYKGAAGIDMLNEVMQDLLNPREKGKAELKLGQVLFREGDKVMLLKNRPDEDVYNGDIGVIAEIDGTNRQITVDFGHVIVDFSTDILFQLTHAWCVSVHKAQGSEYDRVIVCADCLYPFMMNQKLLYTAVSRAKKELLILGNKERFEKRVKARQSRVRQTALPKRLKQFLHTSEDHAKFSVTGMEEEE